MEDFFMKKIVSLLLSLAMTMSMCLSVSAADKFKDAKPIMIDATETGSIVAGNDKTTYKLDLEDPAAITVNLTASIFRVNLTMYDKNGKEIWTDKQTANDTTKMIEYIKVLALNRGTYYLTVGKNSGEGDYSLTLNETPIYENFGEEQGGTDNTPKTANSQAKALPQKRQGLHILFYTIRCAPM